MITLLEFLSKRKQESKDAKAMAYDFVDFLNSDKSSINEQTTVFLTNVYDNLVNSAEIESFVKAVKKFISNK